MPIKTLYIDPVTRVEGHLSVRARVDVEGRTVVQSWTQALMFRGFEVFLIGRPPEDAIHITSRICGVCGAAHANASARANDMALGAVPTPLGVALRDMAFYMTDLVYDHSIILNLLGGPDYSEMIVKKLTPSCWERAKSAKTEWRDVHGYSTIAEIMKDLNPITGKIWQLTVKYQRIAREAGVLLYGRHSHPSTLVPGGISTDLSNATYLFEGYIYRLAQLTAWAKFVLTIWEDLAKFYNEECGYKNQGYTYERPTLFTSGLGDDPELYSQLGDNYIDIYSALDKALARRASPPGLYINGEFKTDKVTEVQRRILEFIDSSFFAPWKDKIPLFTEKDPAGNDLAEGNKELVWHHPWNKYTIPNPQAVDWAGKYSWATTVRLIWAGKIYPFEVGPFVKVWVEAHANGRTWMDEMGHGLIKHGGGKITLTLPPSRGVDDLPKGTWEELTITYIAPPRSTTIERVRGRAWAMALDVAAAYETVMYALKAYSSGTKTASRPWKEPTWALGFGMLEVARGNVEHWMVVKDGKIANYQIHAPTTINVGPKIKVSEFEKYGVKHGEVGNWNGYSYSPFEAAVLHSKVTEEVPPEQWEGLDFVRAVRSFDPCLSCAAHAEFVKDGKVVKEVKKLLTHVCSI